jgi:hypothetical protein
MDDLMEHLVDAKRNRHLRAIPRKKSRETGRAGMDVSSLGLLL